MITVIQVIINIHVKTIFLYFSENIKNNIFVAKTKYFFLKPVNSQFSKSGIQNTYIKPICIKNLYKIFRTEHYEELPIKSP